MKSSPRSAMPTSGVSNTIRRGHLFVLLAVMIPMIFGILGLVVDGGLMRVKHRLVQNVADAAAVAAANVLGNGQANSAAVNAAQQYVTNYNGLSTASVNVMIPPVDGPYAGQSGYVEVIVGLPVPTFFMSAVGGASTYTVKATSIAGAKDATAKSAVVVLDPNPPGLILPTVIGISLPVTPSLHLGGMEVLGLGQLRVNGAVLVDTTWGGLDQNSQPAGSSGGWRSAVSCTPLLPVTSLAAIDIRVTGGVDNPLNYSAYQNGQRSPLKTNRKPVPDPLDALPVPTVSVDPAHVSNTYYGGVTVTQLPIIGPPTTLRPGVYDYIQVTSGTVIMQSGVYIIRGTHPLTGISLSILAGQVSGNGVMFYITQSANYSATTGVPDQGNNSVVPDPLAVLQIIPSVVIDTGLLGTKLSPMTGTGSPYDGILIFQNRPDRRIIVIGGDLLLTSGSFSGNVYAKWGQAIFAGTGTFDAAFAVGSMRFVNVLDVTLQPSNMFAAAKDVFLVQ